MFLIRKSRFGGFQPTRILSKQSLYVLNASNLKLFEYVICKWDKLTSKESSFHAIAECPPLHTGSFAQNFFQIDSINSCSTSKKLQFWLKIVKITCFLALKSINGKLKFIWEIMKKLLGGATSQKSRKEM